MTYTFARVNVIRVYLLVVYCLCAVHMIGFYFLLLVCCIYSTVIISLDTFSNDIYGKRSVSELSYTDLRLEELFECVYVRKNLGIRNGNIRSREVRRRRNNGHGTTKMWTFILHILDCSQWISNLSYFFFSRKPFRSQHINCLGIRKGKNNNTLPFPLTDANYKLRSSNNFGD